MPEINVEKTPYTLYLTAAVVLNWILHHVVIHILVVFFSNYRALGEANQAVDVKQVLHQAKSWNQFGKRIAKRIQNTFRTGLKKAFDTLRPDPRKDDSNAVAAAAEQSAKPKMDLLGVPQKKSVDKKQKGVRFEAESKENDQPMSYSQNTQGSQGSEDSQSSFEKASRTQQGMDFLKPIANPESLIKSSTTQSRDLTVDDELGEDLDDDEEELMIVPAKGDYRQGVAINQASTVRVGELKKWMNTQNKAIRKWICKAGEYYADKALFELQGRSSVLFVKGFMLLFQGAYCMDMFIEIYLRGAPVDEDKMHRMRFIFSTYCALTVFETFSKETFQLTYFLHHWSVIMSCGLLISVADEPLHSALFGQLTCTNFALMWFFACKSIFSLEIFWMRCLFAFSCYYYIVSSTINLIWQALLWNEKYEQYVWFRWIFPMTYALFLSDDILLISYILHQFKKNGIWFPGLGKTTRPSDQRAHGKLVKSKSD